MKSGCAVDLVLNICIIRCILSRPVPFSRTRVALFLAGHDRPPQVLLLKVCGLGMSQQVDRQLIHGHWLVFLCIPQLLPQVLQLCTGLIQSCSTELGCTAGSPGSQHMMSRNCIRWQSCSRHMDTAGYNSQGASQPAIPQSPCRPGFDTPLGFPGGWAVCPCLQKDGST